MKNLESFEKKLGVSFKDKNKLVNALTHSSYANEHTGTLDNERLEYLGDAVLELCMSKYLYIHDPSNEGVLTKNRAKTVCEEALDFYALKLDLDKYLYLGNGEENSGGRGRKAIIADAFEAVLGAYFLDSNFDAVYELFLRIVIPYTEEVINMLCDYKSVLQELIQAGDKRPLTYKLVGESGPSHNKVFEVSVYLDDILMGTGEGRTKKDAEQQAAKQALSKQAK